MSSAAAFSSADATAHPDEVAMAMAMGASAAAGGDADGDGAAGVGAAGDGEIDAAVRDELVRLKMQLLMTGGRDDDALLDDVEKGKPAKRPHALLFLEDPRYADLSLLLLRVNLLSVVAHRRCVMHHRRCFPKEQC